jgi:hypothetical protein
MQRRATGVDQIVQDGDGRRTALVERLEARRHGQEPPPPRIEQIAEFVRKHGEIVKSVDG